MSEFLGLPWYVYLWNFGTLVVLILIAIIWAIRFRSEDEE